ncbi:S41 family peptidase [Terrilactibacillus sp. S3-3]|nr:S41 family peptidase [Terrilactibacillus sp. S3-3]
MEDRNGKKEAYYSSTTKKKPYPIVDLIDSGSASAAEILTGALKEAGGYPVVGIKSFGKGTVQQGIELSDKSELKLTTYKWLTPDGHWIHKKGIQPTVKVKQPDYFYVTPLALKKGKVLSYDHTSTQIVNLQKMLKGVGFDPGRKDGYYSKGTVSAVKAFQKSVNLPASGSADQKGERVANKSHRTDRQLKKK